MTDSVNICFGTAVIIRHKVFANLSYVEWNSAIGYEHSDFPCFIRDWIWGRSLCSPTRKQIKWNTQTTIHKLNWLWSKLLNFWGLRFCKVQLVVHFRASLNRLHSLEKVDFSFDPVLGTWNHYQEAFRISSIWWNYFAARMEPWFHIYFSVTKFLVFHPQL